MSSGSRPIETLRHESGLGAWEMARTRPDAKLRELVRRYVGWWEETSAPLVRRELPTDIIPLIVNFGAPVRIFDTGNADRWTDFESFTTGVYDRYVLVRTSGPSGGLQIDFTILGARLFLSRPLGELMNRAATLDDLIGSAASSFAGKLRDARGWAERFDIVDRELARRFAAARIPPAPAFHTCRRLLESGGATPIATIVNELGCSEKHLVDTFRSEIGLTPKRLARVLRFGRAVDRIKRGETRLAALAQDCGYYDHAHFDRDFKAFAGLTPSELIKSLLPDGGGFSTPQDEAR